MARLIQTVRLFLSSISRFENCSPNDASRPVKRDNGIFESEDRIPFVVGLNVAQVSDMANGVTGTAMSLAIGIEVRTGGCTSVSQITPLTERAILIVCERLNRCIMLTEHENRAWRSEANPGVYQKQ